MSWLSFSHKDIILYNVNGPWDHSHTLPILGVLYFPQAKIQGEATIFVYLRTACRSLSFPLFQMCLLRKLPVHYAFSRLLVQVYKWWNISPKGTNYIGLRQGC